MAHKFSKSRLVELVADGLNNAQIAERAGVSRVTVGRWLKKYGITREVAKAINFDPSPEAKLREDLRPEIEAAEISCAESLMAQGQSILATIIGEPVAVVTKREPRTLEIGDGQVEEYIATVKVDPLRAAAVAAALFRDASSLYRRAACLPNQVTARGDVDIAEDQEQIVTPELAVDDGEVAGDWSPTKKDNTANVSPTEAT